ncbi:inositol hexakisphosphate-domain-containing protein [Gongronella butleri]|nr:inositol hexakisphosphate-domain-containing protein [Gongronella butleri]
MDHFTKGINTKLEFHLEGAPNFRAAELNVYGVAQPTVVGLSSILALLNCHPKSQSKQSCTWFLTREEPLVYLNGNPYVLREYADPLHSMNSFVGINASRLEMVEERLKADVIRESKTLGGLLLVHQELEDGTIVPCFIAADQVQTPKEVFLSFQEKGYSLKYFRIPIRPMQAPEDNYFDEYVRVIKSLDPTDPLIFNCGMGVVRTTMGIVMAQIIRRTQLIEQGYADPFPVPGYIYESDEVTDVLEPLIKGIQDADKQKLQTDVLLRLIYLLEEGLGTSQTDLKSTMQWVFGNSLVVEKFKDAVAGNYYIVSSLVSVLEFADTVINLRDDILLNRIRQTTQGSNDYRRPSSHLYRASVGLQRYMALLCFTAYINSAANTRFETKFSEWIHSREEIWHMVQHMRVKGPQLYYFRPVDDLNSLTNVDRNVRRENRTGMFEMIGAGAQSGVMSLEAEELVLKSRRGDVLTPQTILKIDYWRGGNVSREDSSDEEEGGDTASAVSHKLRELTTSDLGDGHGNLDGKSDSRMHHTFYIDGASNFRRIGQSHIYGVAQPTVNGLRAVLRQLAKNHAMHQHGKIMWINLREEPIIYINGIPYVLRDRYFTLRNMRAYQGITGTRLEQLEERLKQDVIKEIANYGNRILLHGEDELGNVMAAWEDVDPNDVMTVRDVMESVASQVQADLAEETIDRTPVLQFEYHRVPVTAEKSPDPVDFDELRILIAEECCTDSAIVLNCQVGAGRSTLGTVIASLVTRWMYNKPMPSDLQIKNMEALHRPNYQIINSLLRVIKHGLENKYVVDEAIDACGAVQNARDMIESLHIRAENETQPEKRIRLLKSGIMALQRYFVLISFNAYLDDTSPDHTVTETETFALWTKRHAELDTIMQDLKQPNKTIQAMMDLLTPVEKTETGDGMALSSEVMAVVRSRHGQVLAQQTILKHDAFPNCQKMNLREKIDEAYNFRRVQVKIAKRAVHNTVIEAVDGGLAADLLRSDEMMKTFSPPFICGCAMPSKDAIKSVLIAMDAGPNGKRTVIWTCLREEPVLYVNNQPYVLRLYSDPIKNLETTGIAKERVEGMENRMKQDALVEQKEYEGRLLLHDETLDDNGGFTLKAIWETAPIEHIETPKEVFQSIIDDGYRVEYFRIPITDEQAPIPDVFDLLKQRILEAHVGKDVIFNCQMGRGRTTTAMVTACLISMILNNNIHTDESSSLSTSQVLDDADNDELTSTSPSRVFEADRDEAYDERDRYLNGEYKIVLQLISLLQFGQLAKRLTDKAINMCDHMQNLRKAIYDYRLRLESMEDTRSKKYHTMKEVGLNYLVRYFYLIVFAEYLLEEAASPTCTLHTEDDGDDDLLHAHDDDRDEIASVEDANRLTTFSEWLSSHREITNVISLHSFDLS